MTPQEYSDFDAIGLAALLKAGEISFEELHDAALSATSNANRAFNFALDVTDRGATDPTTRDGPLSGVPTLIKDINGHLEGFPMRFGSRFFEGVVSPQSTNVGISISRAGMDVIGVSSAPEFSLEGHCHNLLTGDVLNPWNSACSPGGSSGGAAAAVVSGAVPVAHGSDIAGSIRVPAAWCGCVGLKPSRGRVSSGPAKDEGGFGLASNQFLTRTVRDSAATLDILSQPFPGDPFAVPRPEGTFLALTQEAAAPAPLTIAISTNGCMDVPVSAETVAAVEDVARLLDEAGHRISDIEDPTEGMESLVALTDVWLAGFAAQMDGLGRSLGRPIDDTTFGPVALSAYRHSQRIDLPRFLAAIERLNRTRRQVGAVIAPYDIWLSPVTPGPAPFLRDLPAAVPGADFQHHVEQGMPPFFQHTVIHNIMGLPAISLPLARHPDGRPIGIQLAAPHGREDLLLTLAAFLERACPWPCTALERSAAS